MVKTKRTFGGNRKPIAPPSKQAKIDPSSEVKRVFYAAANDVLDATDESDDATDDTASDESDAEYIVPLLMSREDRKENGRLWASEEELRIYLKVVYIYEFEEPAENEWCSILTKVGHRLGNGAIRRRTMRDIFKSLQNGKLTTKRKAGSGRKMKLAANNEGLIAAAASLNGGTSPKVALEICNLKNPGKPICLNTLKATLKGYTDSDIRAIPRRKTGKKDKQ
jgi:hypothetical protein